jgi:hypothetical protein
MRRGAEDSCAAAADKRLVGMVLRTTRPVVSSAATVWRHKKVLRVVQVSRVAAEDAIYNPGL